MTPVEVWADACERAIRDVEIAHFEVQGECAVEAAERLLGGAHHLLGVGCPECGGRGRRAYGSTATWRRGGIGGQAITEGTCDVCWGTGRTDRTGPNLRRLTQRETDAEALARRVLRLVDEAEGYEREDLMVVIKGFRPLAERLT